MYTMRPAEFEYHRAESVDDAVALLAENADARPLAGGHSLLPLLKVRLSTPAALVDLGRIPGLDRIESDGDTLTVGALAKHAEVGGSGVVHDTCPVLAETAMHIGDRQVRNRGTIGGSVAHADPAADYPTVLKALGATIVAQGPAGERGIPADDFFVGLMATALGPDEIVTAVKVPATRAGTGAVYLKHRHPASSYAVVGVAAAVSVDGGTCTHARVTVGGVGDFPLHAEPAAEALVGRTLSPEVIAEAAARVPDALPESWGDVYASGVYRKHLAGVLARRAVTAAAERATA